LAIIAQVQGCHVSRPITAFKEVGFPEYLMSSMLVQGFPSPTPVQCQGWAMALSGRDMVAIAQTGSGEAIAFALPVMLHINVYMNCLVIQAISLHFLCAPPAKLCWRRVMALSLLYLFQLELAVQI
jgi:superfamily II DNA/RNA helicase